jgi:hypothetical protein
MNRLGLKISCLVASILIWVQVAATTDVEQPARLPLRVSGLAEGLTVAGSEIPSSVSVRLRGSKLRLLTNRFFQRYVGEVRINLADSEPGPVFSYQLTPEDVVTDLEVVRFQRDERIRVRVDRLDQRRLPVAVMLAGELPRGTAFAVEPHAEPDSVLVQGPSRFLPEGGAAATEPVALDRMQAGPNDGIVVPVAAMNEQLRVAPAQVRVRYLAAPLVDPLVDAGRPDVGVSPPVADVMVRGIADSVGTLTEGRLSVTVAVGQLPEGMYLLPGQVDCPPWLTLLGLAPAEFRVIVGDPPTLVPSEPDSAARRAATGGGRG